MAQSGNGFQPGQRHYLVTVHERSYVVAIEDGPNGPTLRVDGKPVSLELASVPGPAVAASIDGQAVRALTRARGEEVDVVLGGETLVVRVEDRRRLLLQRVAGGAQAGAKGEVIRAPMPGLVAGVPVAVGDTVEKGTSVVVLQAMKMENELRSSSAGCVAEVRVEEGQTVEQGQVLVVLE